MGQASEMRSFGQGMVNPPTMREESKGFRGITIEIPLYK
jgi:hypothetical protein